MDTKCTTQLSTSDILPELQQSQMQQWYIIVPQYHRSNSTILQSSSSSSSKKRTISSKLILYYTAPTAILVQSVSCLHTETNSETLTQITSNNIEIFADIYTHKYCENPLETVFRDAEQNAASNLLNYPNCCDDQFENL